MTPVLRHLKVQTLTFPIPLQHFQHHLLKLIQTGMLLPMFGQRTLHATIEVVLAVSHSIPIELDMACAI